MEQLGTDLLQLEVSPENGRCCCAADCFIAMSNLAAREMTFVYLPPLQTKKIDVSIVARIAPVLSASRKT